MRRVVLVSAFLLAVLAEPVAASPAPRSIFQDDQTLLRSGDAVREQALDELAGLGVDAIRVLVVWRNAGDLRPLDALVAGAQRRGMEVLMTPTGPGPVSASRCRPRTPECRPDPRRFGRFVRSLGARYPTVRHWAVWNEPNNPRWLTPQFTRGRRAERSRRGRPARPERPRPASPRHYRRLVLAARAALRATGHGRDELLVGETAPIGRSTGPLAGRPMMPGTFMRALLCRGCARLGTGLSHHAYTRGGSQPPRFPALPGELSIAALGEVVRLARGLPVHLTEGGWQTNPPDTLFGVSLDQQGAYLNETEWLVRNRRRVRSVPQYLLLDEPRRSGFQSGLRFTSGRAKPALSAYRLPIWVVRRGRHVTVWGRVRPARADAPRVEIQRRLPRSRRWTTLATAPADDDVLVRLRAARGDWRLRWTRFTSRTAREARR